MRTLDVGGYLSATPVAVAACALRRSLYAPSTR